MMPSTPSQTPPTTGSPTEPTYLPEHVNIAAPDAAAYWARTFQVPVERVRDAVAAAGSDPEKVAAHLGKPWPNVESGIV